MKFKAVAARVLPLLYFLAVSLPHHPFSDWFDKNVLDPWGHDGVQRLADILSVAFLIVTVALAIRVARVHGRYAIKHFAVGVVLVVLMYAADCYLIVNNIERVHFPQYAVLALLLGLSLRSETLIFLVTTFAGFLDEFLQYVMDPMKTNYLDFNDIVFNILGAAAGVVLLMGLRNPAPKGSGASRYESVFGLVFGVSMAVGGVVVLLAGLFGRIVMLVEQKIDRSVFAVVDGKLSFIMSFERHDAFWMKAYFGKVFHVMSPGEGIAAIVVLCIATWVALRWLKGKRRESTL